MEQPMRRRGFLGLCAAIIPGCTRLNGEDSPASTQENPAFGEIEQLGELELTSPAFEDGDAIPETYGRETQDVNPPLRIDGVHDDAESLALIVDDPDAVEPADKVWVHWLVWNVRPGRTNIPEAWQPTDAVEGTNDFDAIGYGGPDPPDDTHRYRFKLYALETVLDLSAGATKTELGEAMQRTILARTQLDGTYAP